MEALDMDDAPVYGELIVFGRDGMTEQGRFPLQANALLGRCKDSDIRVRRDDVSREHAMLSVENQRVWLTQLSKTNATRVNSTPMSDQPVCLRDGDVLHISDRKFQLVYTDEYKNVPTPEKLNQVPAPYQGSQDYSSLDQTVALDSVLRERNTPAKQPSSQTPKKSLSKLREQSRQHQEQREERIASIQENLENEEVAPQVVDSGQESLSQEYPSENTPHHQFFEDTQPDDEKSVPRHQFFDNDGARLKTPIKDAIHSRRRSYGAKSVQKGESQEEDQQNAEESADSSDVVIVNDEEQSNENNAPQDGQQAQAFSSSGEGAENVSDESLQEGVKSDELDEQMEDSGSADDDIDNRQEESEESGADQELSNGDSADEEQSNDMPSKLATPLRKQIQKHRHSYGAKSVHKNSSGSEEEADSCALQKENSNTESETSGEDQFAETSQAISSSSKLATPIRSEIKKLRKSYGAKSVHKNASDEDMETDHIEVPEGMVDACDVVDQEEHQQDTEEDQDLETDQKLATPLKKDIKARRKSYGARSVRKSTSGKRDRDTGDDTEQKESSLRNKKLATPLRKEIQKHGLSSGGKSSRKSRSSTARPSMTSIDEMDETAEAAHARENENQQSEDNQNAGIDTPLKQDIQRRRKSYGAKSVYKTPGSRRSSVSVSKRSSTKTPGSRKTPGKSPIVSVGKLFNVKDEADFEGDSYSPTVDDENPVDTSIRKALATPIREAIKARRVSSTSGKSSLPVEQVPVSEHFEQEAAQQLQDAGVSSYESLQSDAGNVHLFFGEDGEVLRSVIEPVNSIFTERDRQQTDEQQDQERPEEEEDADVVDWENISADELSSLILNGSLRMDPQLQEEIADAGRHHQAVPNPHEMHSRFAARQSMGLNHGEDRPNEHLVFEEDQISDKNNETDGGQNVFINQTAQAEEHAEEESAFDDQSVEKANDEEADQAEMEEENHCDRRSEEKPDDGEAEHDQEHELNEMDGAAKEESLDQDVGEEDDREEGEIESLEDNDAPQEIEGEGDEYSSDGEGYVFSPELETICESEVETDAGTTPGRFSMSARYSTPGFPSRRSKGAKGSQKRRAEESPKTASTQNKRQRPSSSTAGMENVEKQLDVSTTMEAEEVEEKSENVGNDQQNEEAQEPEQTDFSKLTVAELRKILDERGLSTKGKKAQLVTRLEEADSSDNAKIEEDNQVQHSAEEPQVEEVNTAKEDYSSWKVTELRTKLKELGLDTRGRKAELVERLEAQAHDSQPEDTKEEEEKVDLSKLKVAELKQMLASKGLDTSGRKGELIHRLIDAGVSNESEDKDSAVSEAENKDAAVLEPGDKDAGVSEEAPKPQAPDYRTWKVPELRRQLEAYGLSSAGTKVVLIERLEAYDSGYDLSGEQTDDGQVDPSTMTVKQLREELKFHNLDTSGKKAALVKRYREGILGQ